MRAFFKFFGAKHRAVNHYPPPDHELVVEPFAGSAAYAVRHSADRRAILVDRDPLIASLWSYLVRVKVTEVRRLPLLLPNQRVSELKRIPEEARTLIGFWMRTGSAEPRDVPSPWAKNPAYADRFWGEHIRERIARQVVRIRDWEISCGEYLDCPNERATWFIDPPYEHAGSVYRFGPDRINYKHLSLWVKKRRGLVIACEGPDASWLPFAHLRVVRKSVNVRGDGALYNDELVYVQSR